MTAADMGHRAADLIAFIAVLVVATWLVIIVHESTPRWSATDDCTMSITQGAPRLMPPFCRLP